MIHCILISTHFKSAFAGVDLHIVFLQPSQYMFTYMCIYIYIHIYMYIYIYMYIIKYIYIYNITICIII